MKQDYILLKWGTLKGWCFQNSPEAVKLFDEWAALGSSFSAMMQKDTPEQKQLICKMIDAVNGPVSNDWEGTTYETKEDAKKYVLEYGKEKK